MANEEKEPTKQHYIVAPHPDDELIGCFEVINDPANTIAVMYPTDIENTRREEALKLREHKTNVNLQIFQASIPPTVLSDANVTFYFPDPANEIHPEHRAWGMYGEGLARSGKDVIFYTTIMNVPYIHEVQSKYKEALLNTVYPSQKDLWRYEKKYVLFEGRCKWIF